MAKILIVDGSILDRKRMRNMLEAAGHSVQECESPGEARTILEQQPPGTVKLLLTEVDFPGAAGVELIRWIKSQPAMGSLPVLVVSEQKPRQTVIEMVSAGATTVITKPFGGDMLLRRVTEALSEADALRQGDGERLTWQLEDYLRRELKRAERSGANFSVIACQLLEPRDPQGFERFMSHVLHAMRESDVVLKHGEERLMILLPDTDGAGARAVEGRVKLSAQQADAAGQKVSLALGCATYPGEASDAEGLIAAALARVQA